MEVFWRTFGWFTLVWFVSTGVMLIVLQTMLPYAWKQLRAQPPHGPGWAYTLWYRRSQLYGAIVTLALLFGGIAALIYLSTGG
jgi:hypothetical protein